MRKTNRETNTDGRGAQVSSDAEGRVTNAYLNGRAAPAAGLVSYKPKRFPPRLGVADLPRYRGAVGSPRRPAGPSRPSVAPARRCAINVGDGRTGRGKRGNPADHLRTNGRCGQNGGDGSLGADGAYKPRLSGECGSREAIVGGFGRGVGFAGWENGDRCQARKSYFSLVNRGKERKGKGDKQGQNGERNGGKAAVSACAVCSWKAT